MSGKRSIFISSSKRVELIKQKIETNGNHMSTVELAPQTIRTT